MKAIKTKNDKQICKVIYFDEDSVTDYLQIIAGGSLEKTTELLEQSGDKEKAELEAKGGFSIGALWKSLIGANASIGASLQAEASFSTDQMVKNIVKNTLLSDFIDSVQSEEKCAIKHFKGYELTAPDNSLSFIAVISPYLNMLKGAPSIPAGDFNIAVEKLDNTIKQAKGYYEFVGENKEKNRVIFRFNIKSFKNNYKIADLLKMDIILYAIKVGTSTINDLTFNNEIGSHSYPKDNPDYKEIKTPEEDQDKNAQPLNVYDVLLAGVESDD